MHIIHSSSETNIFRSCKRYSDLGIEPGTSSTVVANAATTLPRQSTEGMAETDMITLNAN